MRNKLNLLSLVIFIVLTSCNLGKKIPGITTEARYKNQKQLLQALHEQTLEYDWYVGSGRVRYKGGGTSFSSSAEIKMRQDSVVWCRLTKIGMELAKILADTGKFTLLNNLNRTYQQESIEQLYELTSVVEANFGSFQNLMLGIFPDNYDWVKEMSFDENNYVLIGEIQGIKIKLLLNAAHLRMSEMWLDDPENEKMVQLIYSQYEPLNQGKTFVPKSINLTVSAKEETNIDISFSKIELKLNDKIDFEIPNDFKKVE